MDRREKPIRQGEFANTGELDAAGGVARRQAPVPEQPSSGPELPEGLRRARKGPYDRETGRNEEPLQVPQPPRRRRDRR
jgi:hypothetical protein